MIGRWLLLGTASNLAAKLLTMGVAFLLTPLVVHRLGDVQYGLWALAGSFLAYGGLLDLGIADALVKYVAEYRARGELERAHGVVATALWLYAGLGAAGLCACAAVAPFVADLFVVPADRAGTATALVVILGLQLAIGIPCTAAGAVLRGLQRYDLFNAVNVVSVLCSAAATAGLLLAGGGVLALAASNILFMLLTQAATVWCIRRVAPELGFGWRGARLSAVPTILSFSLAIFVAQSASRIQWDTDRVIVGAYLPVSAVAPYALAQRLSDVPTIFARQVMKLFLPLASRLHAEADAERLRLLFLTGTRVSTAVCLAPALAVAVLAGPVLDVWVGPAYAAAGAPLLVCLSIGCLAYQCCATGEAILQGTGKPHRLAAMWLGAAVLDLVLSFALIGRYGALGVAVGTTVPNVLIPFGFVLPLSLRAVGVGWSELLKRAFWPVAAPAVPMLAVLYGAAHSVATWTLLSLLAVMLVAFAVYGLVYFGLAAGTPEREMLGAAWARTRARLLPRVTSTVRRVWHGPAP